MPDRFQKVLILQSQGALPAPRIDLAGLRLVLVMAMTWLPGIRAANGFAEGVTLDQDLDFDGSLLDAIDERRDDPERFAFLDGLDRECFWMQNPAGWDSAEEQHAVSVSWSLVRRLGRVGCRVSVSYADLTSGALTYPVFIDMVTAEEQIDATSDDAMNRGTTYPGTMYYEQSGMIGNVLTIGMGSPNYYMAGFVFTPPIPQGVTVESAAISLESGTNQNSNFHVRIYAEDADNPGTWAIGTHEPYMGYNSRTTASAEWDVGTTAWVTGQWYDTSDLSAVVQETVDRGGWSDTNTMAFVIVDINSGTHYRRTVRDYSYGVSVCAKFNCSYTEAAGPSGWVLVIEPDE